MECKTECFQHVLLLSPFPRESKEAAKAHKKKVLVYDGDCLTVDACLKWF